MWSKKVSFGVLFWTYIFFVEYVAAELPSYIKVCKKTEPDVDSCIKNSVEILRPMLLKGIPELDVPPVEPLKISKISLKRGPEAANIAATITDLEVWGPGSFKILHLKSNLAKNEFFFKILVPKLYFEGKYEMNMRILLLTLDGKGDITGNFTNYKADVLMKGNKVKRGETEHLIFDKMKMKIDIGEARVHLTNLFNGDPVLGSAANQIINENSKAFVDEIAPNLENAVSDLFTDIANRITIKFRFDELFP